MVPANLLVYNLIPEIRGKKLPVCHTAMVPWTAAFVANPAGEGKCEKDVYGDSGVYTRSVRPVKSCSRICHTKLAQRYWQ